MHRTPPWGPSRKPSFSRAKDWSGLRAQPLDQSPLRPLVAKVNQTTKSHRGVWHWENLRRCRNWASYTESDVCNVLVTSLRGNYLPSTEFDLLWIQRQTEWCWTVQKERMNLSQWIPLWNRAATCSPSPLGFSDSSDSKDSVCNARDMDSIPGFGRSPGGGHGNPLQYSCLENPHGQRSLVGYSPWGRTESDTTEQLSTPSPLSLELLYEREIAISFEQLYK